MTSIPQTATRAGDHLIDSTLLPCRAGDIRLTLFNAADGTGTFLILTLRRGSRHFRAFLSPTEHAALIAEAQKLHLKHRTP